LAGPGRAADRPAASGRSATGLPTDAAIPGGRSTGLPGVRSDLDRGSCGAGPAVCSGARAAVLPAVVGLSAVADVFAGLGLWAGLGTGFGGSGPAGAIRTGSFSAGTGHAGGGVSQPDDVWGGHAPLRSAAATSGADDRLDDAVLPGAAGAVRRPDHQHPGPGHGSPGPAEFGAPGAGLDVTTNSIVGAAGVVCVPVGPRLLCGSVIVVLIAIRGSVLFP
jgi:hypothetical protein